MKRFYSRFRIMLLTLALGMASVTFFNGLYERWSEISVDLPQVQSETPIYVFPKQVLTESVLRERELANQARDLSIYDFGGESSNCFNHGFNHSEFQNCKRSLR